MTTQGSGRAFAALTSLPWAIEPDWLLALADMAQRNFQTAQIEALREERAGRAPRPYQLLDGTAIIPINGPIFPRASLFQMISGATSLAVVESWYREALADPQVTAILLDVDSPGGVATGINEFADLVHATRDRKPLAVYARGLACSAAYWIASAAPAGGLWAETTAMLGSIGVVTAVPVQEAAGQDGVRRIEVVSSNARNKRPDPRTDEGLATVRATLDAIEDRFVAAVARNRGVDAGTVLSDFGQGGTLVGSDAVRAGMADRVGNFDQVLSHLAGLAATRRETTRMTTQSTTTTTTETDPPATADSLASAFPAQVAEIRAAAATAERDRILGIEAQSLPGHEKLISALKADGRTTPAEAAIAVLAAEKQAGAARLAAIQADGSRPVPPPAAAPAPGAPAAADTALPLETRAKAAWESDAALQAEFRSFAAYHAFLKAQDGGRIRAVGRAA